ncbi:MAG: ketopantoate reductase family protein [Pseudomonadota bacterium]
MSHSEHDPFLPPALASWHILGAGAIGGLWALRLAARGMPVTLLAHADPAAQRTLSLHDGAALQQRAFPQCPPTAPGRIDNLLVASKAHLTQAALAPLLPQLGSGTPVVLLQNGMGVDDRLCAERPDLCVLTAITSDGVFRRDRDTLVLAGRGETLLGAARAQDESAARGVAAALGMSFAADILRRRWHKLAVNCAINPLTARYRCRNGELLQKAESLAVMRAVCAEIAAVMQAEGLPATAETLFGLACNTAAQTAANLSSLRADVEAGRDTEIRFLNGYVVARAARHGLAAPANAALLAEILALP